MTDTVTFNNHNAKEQCTISITCQKQSIHTVIDKFILFLKSCGHTDSEIEYSLKNSVSKLSLNNFSLHAYSANLGSLVSAVSPSVISNTITTGIVLGNNSIQPLTNLGPDIKIEFVDDDTPTISNGAGTTTLNF